jgi:hypothetical protein
MLVRRIFPIVGIMMCLPVVGASQQKDVRHVPVKATSPASAPEMYTAYCAVCHGIDGKGRGPAADALKVPPPDLTMLAKGMAAHIHQTTLGAQSRATCAYRHMVPKKCPSGAVCFGRWVRDTAPKYSCRSLLEQVHRIAAGEIVNVLRASPVRDPGRRL